MRSSTGTVTQNSSSTSSIVPKVRCAGPTAASRFTAEVIRFIIIKMDGGLVDGAGDPASYRLAHPAALHNRPNLTAPTWLPWILLSRRADAHEPAERAGVAVAGV